MMLFRTYLVPRDAVPTGGIGRREADVTEGNLSNVTPNDGRLSLCS